MWYVKAAKYIKAFRCQECGYEGDSAKYTEDYASSGYVNRYDGQIEEVRDRAFPDVVWTCPECGAEIEPRLVKIR